MSHMFKDCLFLMILGTLFRVGCTQTVTTNNPLCGESVIELGSESREFNIPPVGTATGPILCTYTITSKPFTNILYNITSINIGIKDQCEVDHLIFASFGASIDYGEGICGTETPDEPPKSYKNTAYIVFNISTQNLMDNYVKGSLVVVPEENSAICGPRFVTLNTTTTHLRIPPKGTSFLIPDFCFYNIQGSDDKVLSFNVTNIDLGVDGRCYLDYLKVAEDEWHIDNATYVVCGKETPKEIFKSTSNSIFLLIGVATSPESTFVEAICNQEPKTPAVIPNEPSCGDSNIVLGYGLKEFNIPSKGTFTYPINCTYTITSPIFTKISFDVISMQVGDGSSCETDFLIFSSSWDGLCSAQKICGTETPKKPFISRSNTAYIMLSLGSTQSEGNFVDGVLSAYNSAIYLTSSLEITFYTCTCIWLHLFAMI